MPRTTNRSPLEVNTGSSNFARQHFFNQTSWSGMNDNRNIATIDPQSFNDCNNVFLDLNNVLTSRPAFKKNGLFADEVVRFWEVPQKQVLEYTVEGVIRLKGSDPLVSIVVGQEMSLIQIEGRVFIFNNDNCWIYEDKTFTLVTRENIQEYIYMPEVEIVTDGNPKKFESENMATDYVAYTYLRGVESFVDEDELNGEVVYYQDENGEEANVLWVANITNRILLDFYTRRKFEYISMAKNGSGAIGVDNNQLFYTTNGLAWAQLPMPESRLGYPKITHDGMTALILLPQGLYALTLVPSGMDGEAEFPSWTNICKPFTRQYKKQTSNFLNGTLRSFTTLLGLEAISYDNYVLIAAGPATHTDSTPLVNVYTTHPSFSRLSTNSEGEKLYNGMSIETSDANTDVINFTTRADKTNSYTRIPICRTLEGVDLTQKVKIRLKPFLHQNSQLFAILFKADEFNSKIVTGLPEGVFYYNNEKVLIQNTGVDPDTNTEKSNSDKLRYSVFFVNPGTTGLAVNHTLTALGDPLAASTINIDFDSGDDITNDHTNLLQREVRTRPLNISAAELDSSLSDYGTLGSQLSIENIGFEFMESQVEVASQNYELRFFFPLSAYSEADGGNISLGLFDKSITIRNGESMAIIVGAPEKPKKNGVINDFEPGDTIISGTKANFSETWFRLRAGSTNRKIGLRADFVTDAKNKNQVNFTGTAKFLAPSTNKFKLDSDLKINGSASSMSENSDECILQRGGSRETANNITFNETDLINLLRDAANRRMTDMDTNYKTIDNLDVASKVYSAMNPAEYDSILYDSSGGTYYKLRFDEVDKHYTVTTDGFDNPDKVIYVTNSDRTVKNHSNRPVTDKGDYYIDCWFNWEGYQITYEPYTYDPDAGWNINDSGIYVWYNSTSPIGEPGQPNTPDGQIYSNKLSALLNDIPYYISEKDLDRTVLTPEFLLVHNLGSKYGSFHPTVSSFTEIQYFGEFSFVKNAAGFYLTSLYTTNKELKYYYKQGREFKLRVLDGWIENSKKIYGWISNTIFIEDRRYNKDKKPLLYIPSENVEQRDKIISKLVNFTKGVIGIFHENEIWYMYPNYDADGEFVGYIYSRGRVGLGVMLGGDVETLYDGKTICFPTYRGIVGLQYEQLTQNEEQILTYLSDNIMDYYQKFYNRSGKGCLIFQYQYWIYFWQEGFKDGLILDVRNSSWWPFSFSKPIQGFAKYKDLLYVKTEDGWATPTDEGWYLDYDKDIISWFFQSQELHFNFINNKKRIVNITLQSIETDEKRFSAILTCRNFRKSAFVSKDQVLEYKVDVLRTYVHRLNYMQTNEFQYKLSNDEARAPKEQTPAFLTATIVKYEVGEAVR